MQRNLVLNWCFSHLEQATLIKSGSEIHSRCPLCGDSKKDSNKKRMHINMDKNRFHCFNCQQRGEIHTLIKLVEGCSVKEAKKIAGYKMWETVKQFLEKIPEQTIPDGEVRQNEKTRYDLMLQGCSYRVSKWTSPKGCIAAAMHRKALGILQERRLNPECHPYRICHKGRYSNRLIIPIINNGHTVYFQGRALSRYMEPKYLNPSSPKHEVILNVDKFSENRSILVFEGPLDALSLVSEEYKNSTCCIGQSPGKEFIETLLKKTKRNVIICLDNNIAGIKGMLSVWKEWNHEPRVKYFLLAKYKKYKDVNEWIVKENVTSEEIINIIEARTTESNMFEVESTVYFGRIK